MRTIHKYALDQLGVCTIRMPAAAEFLSVQVQRGAPVLWALVDTEVGERDYTFYVATTGEDLSDVSLMKYLGTFQRMARASSTSSGRFREALPPLPHPRVARRRLRRGVLRLLLEYVGESVQKNLSRNP